MTDRALIPLDQPYGNRQQTVDLMRQAGQPQGAGSAPARPATVQGAQPAAPADFLQARQPARPMGWTPPDPVADLRNLAQTSPNAWVRAILGRVLAG